MAAGTCGAQCSGGRSEVALRRTSCQLVRVSVWRETRPDEEAHPHHLQRQSSTSGRPDFLLLEGSGLVRRRYYLLYVHAPYYAQNVPASSHLRPTARVSANFSSPRASITFNHDVERRRCHFASIPIRHGQRHPPTWDPGATLHSMMST